MKSKKKLIYKLHQNINENPFKQKDEVSFRNAGVKSYDYKKLKSIRAISLKGLESDPTQSQKHNSNGNTPYNLKMNMLSMKDQIQQQVQQSLICNKKKINIDKTQINMQSKKLNVRNLLKQKIFQRNHLIEQQKYFNSKCNLAQNENQDIPSPQPLTKYNEQKPDYSLISSLPHTKNSQYHSRSRNTSLPIIKHYQYQNQNYITVLNSKRQPDLLVQEEKTKQQVFKQLRFNQQKINKQVFMSIKLKSIQNLQKIAKSHSEVIKIDKWKEKYGNIRELKNSEQSRMKDKDSYAKYLKGFGPQIQQKINNNVQISSSKQKLQPSNRYIGKSQVQLTQLQKSQIQLAKESLNKASNFDSFCQRDQALSPNYLSYLQRQFSSIQPNQTERKSPQLEHYFSTQLLAREKHDKMNFLYSQPLKITITQLKKTDKQNKHKQNLQIKKDKQPNDLLIDQINPKEQCQLEHQFKNMIISSTKSQAKDEQTQGQRVSTRYSPFKTQSKLYLSLQKALRASQQPQALCPPVILNTKQTNPKNKLNKQNTILNTIVNDIMPMEWQSKKYNDEQIVDFDIFVRNQNINNNDQN